MNRTIGLLALAIILHASCKEAWTDAVFGPIRYEAELAEIHQGRVTADPSTSGGHFVGGLGTYRESYVQFYEVSVPVRGEYTLTIGFATIGGGADIGTHMLSINGQPRRPVHYRSTGDWRNFQTIALQISLDTGTNVLRLANAGFPVQVDFIEISQTPDQAVRTDALHLDIPAADLIFEDLNLPQRGITGSKIEWISSRPDIISSEGRVSRPEGATDDIAVTLTAILQHGSAEIRRSFDGVVQGRGFAGLEPVRLQSVRIDDPFWNPVLERLRSVMIPAVYAEISRRDAFPVGPINKWLEAASNILAHYPDDASLREIVDREIARVPKLQAERESGYLGRFPEERWIHLYRSHELYAAGFWISAGIAHYRATGSRALLDPVIRFADVIVEELGYEHDGKLEMYGDVQGVKLALLDLYRVTGDERYIDSARFFLERRGVDPSQIADRAAYSRAYRQDHEPAPLQREAVGHCVCATYQYWGATELAMAKEDDSLLQRQRWIARDIESSKEFVTGGIGAFRAQESFHEPYHLPTDLGYAETCAAIGWMRFNQMLLHATADARYGDAMERILYNAILAGVSADGERFFYDTPQARHADGDDRRRRSRFAIICCPPNLVRTLAALPELLYARSEDALYVNFFTGSTVQLVFNDQPVHVRQYSEYPWEGESVLIVETSDPVPFTLMLRRPGWARGMSVEVNGEQLTPLPDTVRGFVPLDRTWKSGDTVKIHFPMPVEWLLAHPFVKDAQGRTALQRGPIVYCFEGADHECSLSDIQLRADGEISVQTERVLPGIEVPVLRGYGARLPEVGFSPLYFPDDALERIPVRAIPYFLFDNRGAGEMRTWMNRL